MPERDTAPTPSSATTAPAASLSEGPYRLMFERNPEAMWVYDLESLRFLAVNDAAVARYGYTREQFLAMTIKDIRPSEDVPDLLRDVAATDGQLSPARQWRHRLKDGRLIFVDITAHLLPFEGRPGRLVLAHDVTGRVEAQRALRHSEARFRAVARATTDAVWDWDLPRDRVWWSEGVQDLFGYSQDELEGSSDGWIRRIHPDDKQRVLDGVEHSLASGAEVWRGEYRFARRDGSYAWVADRAFTVRDAAGQPLRMVGGMSDITPRLELEAQLRQAQRLEAVGHLTGGVAHDFNNLLTVILGNADLLAEQLANQPALLPLAQMTRDAAQRGADLTHRLLAFARRQALQPQAIDVNQLLAGMDGLLRRALSGDIEIELVRGAGLWTAKVDAAQLESALLNLALNARDAMPEGGKLTLETANAAIDQDYADRHNEVQPGQYVLVSVSDTGTGISPEHLAQVFEPFFTTKGPGKGSGLGLSMVYGFVKQSQGHIKLYSEPGHGTTARLYLPRASGGPVAAVLPTPATEQFRGSATILLVEDDELVRGFAAEQLSGLGYRVLSADNGVKALEIVRAREDIDLLFTDVVMPGGMSGRQLADAALALRPTLKVLYTSGYTENAIVHHGRLDRGVHLLNKPYRRSDLARKVHAVLAATHPAGDAE